MLARSERLVVFACVFVAAGLRFRRSHTFAMVAPAK
jgi:hypothetical protein